jgi:hypothetical protein
VIGTITEFAPAGEVVAKSDPQGVPTRRTPPRLCSALRFAREGGECSDGRHPGDRAGGRASCRKVSGSVYRQTHPRRPMTFDRWMAVLTLLVAIAAALEALWAQFRFAVVEHAAKFSGAVTALWSWNAKWIQAGELLNAPNFVPGGHAELRARIFENLLGAGQAEMEARTERGALRLLARHFDTDVVALIKLSLPPDPDHPPSFKEFLASRRLRGFSSALALLVADEGLPRGDPRRHPFGCGGSQGAASPAARRDNRAD